MVEEEPEAWWMYGVEPGALAESGSTAPEAHSNFRDAFRRHLHDVAAGAPGLDEFRAELESFCHDRGADDSDGDRWVAALTARRAGAEGPDPFDRLERRYADDHTCGVNVERLVGHHERHQAFSPEENRLETIALPEAA